MNQQANIKSTWLRIILFIAVLLSGNLALLNMGAGIFASGTAFQFYWAISTGVICAIISVMIFCRFIEHRKISSTGTAIPKPFHAVIGLLTAVIILGLGTLTLIAGKNLHWLGVQFAPRNLFMWIILMAAVALSEEMAFRGYIQYNLMNIMPSWWALIVAAAIFAFFHANNPGTGILPILNIFLGGILLGMNYIYTRNLWFGILFHFTWNFYQGPILGFKVSGIDPGSLFRQELSGNSIFTGGEFGFEGSLVFTIYTLIGIIFLAWAQERILYRSSYVPASNSSLGTSPGSTKGLL